ncbi:MAG: hypothetical protein MUF49_15130 [Oculatellaceae cyanobacterium Prado106]|jgi:hypothetical protein|nr:hypothetical protein [Oculatellaceae cyanobacterium Prado106]
MKEFTPEEYALWISFASDRELLQILPLLQQLPQAKKHRLWDILPQSQRDRLKAAKGAQ